MREREKEADSNRKRDILGEREGSDSKSGRAIEIEKERQTKRHVLFCD